jgi:hypothetical protein
MEISNKNSWISKFIFEELPLKEILKMYYKWGDLLYEFPAETRLTVYRRLDIRVQLQLVGTQKNVDIFIIFEVFFRSNAFVHYEEGCGYFSDKVYEKLCLEMYSFIDLLDQS